MAQKQRLVVRYYLWADDGPWRLPVQLHQDLFDRKVALPQYAGSKLKVLEVFARWITSDTYSLKGRGSIFSFDEKGFLEQSQPRSCRRIYRQWHAGGRRSHNRQPERFDGSVPHPS
jgi:hypothetical protein